MNTPKLPMYLNPTLTAVLRDQHNMKLEDYRPAYGGESAALDLYHAGPTMVIPPSLSMRCTEEKLVTLPGGQSYSVPQTLANWLDADKDQRDTHFKVLIPTGVHLALPPGWVALIRGRGSVSNTPLILRAGVIDPGYTGEIWVSCINASTLPFTIGLGEKLPFQIVVVPFASDFHSVSAEEYRQLTTKAVRGTGQIGSSDQSAQ